MQPLLKTTLRYRKNKVGKLGFPERYTAVLFTNRLELYQRDILVDTFLVADMRKAALGKGVIVIRLNDGQTLSLYFRSVPEKLGNGSLSIYSALNLSAVMTGLLYSTLTAGSRKNKANAEAWLAQLQALGVPTITV